MRIQTPALMVQGTSSNAGKSLLAAALCRIFTQDGLRVAPFKSQNMALNACVTPDGLEMGRAQAVQAAACRRPPDVRMNPVLLKPTSETGSQVVVLGKPVGVMQAREYWDFKPQAFAAARTAYDELAAEADLMILEGAGSPAEINLRQYDMVNMAMARHARARVLLVGDIDRGGVFAALVGTMALLEDWERDLVAGLIINKFRGDASFLPPALEFTAAKTGKPILGVVPWVAALNLPDEDSVSFKAGAARGYGGTALELDIALIDLPRISNFTDMDALAVEPDVAVRLVRHPRDLGCPDLIVVPGSKNTLADLAHLRETGLAEALTTLMHGTTGPTVIGICGGLQMLGRVIRDPHRLEQGGDAPGLGFLDLDTTLAPEKTLRRVRGFVHGMHTLADATAPGGLSIDGYEIHHGRTVAKSGPAARIWMTDESGAAIGWTRDDGRVWAGYAHGLFDDDVFRRCLLDELRQRKGLAPVRQTTPYSLEPALDRLADAVRAALDMDALRALICRV